MMRRYRFSTLRFVRIVVKRTSYIDEPFMSLHKFQKVLAGEPGMGSMSI